MRPEKNLSALFGIPAEENLLADFPGFFGKSVRCRCHIFITGKFFCFQCHGHIKEKSKEKAIPWSSILNVAKKSSARIVLHPISIVTSDNVELYFLFLNRAYCYEIIYSAWKGDLPSRDRKMDLEPLQTSTNEKECVIGENINNSQDIDDHDNCNKQQPTQKQRRFPLILHYYRNHQANRKGKRFNDIQSSSTDCETGSAYKNHVLNADLTVVFPKTDYAPIITDIPIESVYDIQNEIGTGAYSIVKYMSHKQTHVNYAVKIIDKESVRKEKKELLEREVDILRRIQHPNIVSIHEIYETKENLYLVMELATGGELFDTILQRGHLSEREASRIIREVTEAVDYLHSKMIVHRDLKPENLLLANSDIDSPVKLADFGLSRVLDDEEAILITDCGTPNYVAPEVLLGEGYGMEVDVWSIGVIAYILLCGYAPFDGRTIRELFDAIVVGAFRFDPTHWADISTEAKDLISHMLVVDPKKRYTTKQVLQHQWIIGVHCSDRNTQSTVNQLGLIVENLEKENA